MKLLDAQQVSFEKAKTEQEKRERIRKLNDEETAAVARTNKSREDEKAEAKRLDDLVQKKRNEAATEITALDVRISSRRSELKDLLKPIDDQRKEASSRLEAVAQREAGVLKRETDIDDRDQVLAERLEALIGREEDAVEKGTELHRRESALKDGEIDHKRSFESLAMQWSQFHADVAKANKDLERREKEIADVKKANDAVRQSNESEAKRLTQERRAIHDSYIALDQAKRHLGIE